MLGNLFSQKKDTEETQQPQPQADRPLAGTAPMQAPTPVPPPVTGQTVDVTGAAMSPLKRQDLSALSHLDSSASQVVSQAKQEAQRLQQASIEPLQLLYGLLFNNDIVELLTKFSVDVAKLTREIQQKEQMGSSTGAAPTLSDASKQIIEQAFAAAKNRGSEFLSPEDILLSLFSASSDATALLSSQGISKDSLEEKLEKTSLYSSGKRSVLSQFGIDLTAQAKEGTLDPVVGREKEIERLVHILLRRTKNNPIIIGEAGVGKTAVIEGLAQEVVDGKAPKELLNKKIIQLDLSSLVAGASHRGEFEERLRNVIKETQAAGGQIILFIDEIHSLIGAGDNEGAMDASNIVKPFLARGQLQIIGTTTTAEYRKYFEKDKAFERRFQPIIVDEPNEETAIKMLEVLKPKYEKFHSVVLPPEALQAAVHLSKKYIGERFLPDKAVDLLDEAAAEVRLLHSQGKRADNQVQKADIEKIVSSWTGIPITKLTEDESEKLLHIEDLIHERFIDQKAAVASVSEAVRRGRIGLAAANRPIASFVFLGPTGVGKTELAKTLAQILFGRDDAMARLDMSEYMEKHEVAKLIGAPPGYVGYEEGGQLTEAVRRKPYSIVLLDEIEKAHPDVFNILLQLLEDGRLTDNKGNTISFKNTIIIATSNIGSSIIQEKLSSSSGEAGQASSEAEQDSSAPIDSAQDKSSEQDYSASSEQDKKFEEATKLLDVELHKFFKPELLNRFDEVVVFKPLAKEDMHKIAKLGIAKTEKLLKEQGFSLTITDGALSKLAEEGYDPVYGARPLRRLIQSAIENPIALLLIQKTFVSGDTIQIDYDTAKEEYAFTKLSPPAQPAQGTQANPAAVPQNPAAAVQPQFQAASAGLPPAPNAPQAASPAPAASQNGILAPQQPKPQQPEVPQVPKVNQSATIS